MDNRKMQRRVHSDEISDLPDNVIASILARLPIRDTVRTSSLSRNWRYKWTELPYLVFDASHPNRSLFELSNASQFNNEDELVKVIYRILCQHKGPLLLLSLLVQSERIYPDVDQWLNFLSSKGVRVINLECLNRDRYTIHSSLFSCVHLRLLRLQNCIIPSPPPTFSGFEHLTFLMLWNVTVRTEEFEKLVAKFHQIKGLYLIYVHGLNRLNIDHAPKLKSLTYIGNLNHICLKNTPSLSHVRIGLTKLPQLHEENNELSCLSNLTTMVAGYYFFKFLAVDGIRRWLPSTFDHLVFLCMVDVMFDDIDSLPSVVQLIRSSPNLRELIVSANTNSAANVKAATEYLEGESRSIGCLKELRKVEMSNISGLGPEMELMKLILGNSPLLLRMKIKAHKKVDVNQEPKILKDLVRFPRASSVAEIIYQNKDHSSEN